MTESIRTKQDPVHILMSRNRIWVTLAVTLLCLLVPLSSPHFAVAKTVTWTQYDVDLTLLDGGEFRVEEVQTVEFSGGPFTFAFAEIPLTRVDDITNISVSEIRNGDVVAYEQSDSEEEETFTLARTSSAITITWFMPETFNQERTFVLAYDVIGGLRVYDSESGPRQQIWWTAIADDVTDIAPIESGTFEIHLPEPVELSAVQIDGPGDDDPAQHSTDGQDFAWDQGYMDSGDSLEARIEFPAIVSAAVPAWQVDDDEQRLREQDRDARDALLKLFMVAVGILTGIAGGVGLFGLWYSRGRDPGVGLVAEYLSEPPDDLPPGAAGALVDEYVNQRDIVATLVDLGHRGVLTITEKTEGNVFSRRDFEIELKQPVTDLRPFERAFVTAILGSHDVGAKVDLGSAKARFGSQVGKIENQMYDEVVKRGYFQTSPETTRSKYRAVASFGFAIGIILVGIFGARLIGLSGWILIPLSVLLIVFGALFFVAKVMPRKTYAGAETAAKWRAFKRYLDDLDKNRATEGATELFDKFLPYAVAFGIERSWVQKFADAGAPPPEWYGGSSGGGWYGQPGGGGSYRRQRSGWGGWVGVPSAGGPASNPGGEFNAPNMPDFQNMSDNASGSLQDMSGGLFDLFDLAGSAFESFGSSGSGGGGSRHGGFSGGGRSGGGGGGGSRGFG